MSRHSEESQGRGTQSTWVDPRLSPRPPATPKAPAEDPVEIEPLVRLCQRGKVYAVERWIAEGRPLQAAKHYVKGRRQFDSPLAVAMESKQHDLVLLLLCNGYRTELELEDPIGRALRLRSRELLELVMDWGADPARVDAGAVLETNDCDLIERFWSAGIDLTAEDQLAWYLSSPTSKPICGWAKRHREDPRVARALALALVEVIWNRKERATHLLVWAGADPHQPVPILEWKSRGSLEDDEEDTYTAVETAVERGQGKLLKVLRPDPEVDDFAKLFANVCDPETVDFLMRIKPPGDWSEAVRRNVWQIANDTFGDPPEEQRWCLERIAHYGGRLTILEPRDLHDLRRDILRMTHPDRLRWLLNWLGNPRFCDPTVYDRLVGTPAMQTRIGELGLRTRLKMMRGSRRSSLCLADGVASRERRKGKENEDLV
jgi:hypothetical protein